MRLLPLQNLLSEVDSTQIARVEESLNYLKTTPADQLFSDLLDKAVSFGLKVLAALVIYAVGAIIIKWLKKLLRKVFQKKGTDKAVETFVLSLISITLMVVLVLVIVGILGINTTSIAALLAAGGMAIGMALSGTVQNFAGGIMLMIFKPFKAGDYIVAQGYNGIVTKVTIVSTYLTTTDNREVIIPNGTLSNGTIDNYSHNPLRRLEWEIGVEYGTDSQAVIDALKEILESDPRILTVATGAPFDPMYALSAMNDSSVGFIARGWVRQDDYWDVKFDINRRIYDELPPRGVSFAFPHLDVKVIK